MFTEFKSFLKVKNILLENFSFSLKNDEQILNEFCNCFLDVLKLNNLEIPEQFNFNNLNTSDNKTEYVFIINTSPQKYINLNFLLKKLFYKDLQLSIIEKIYKDLKNKLNSKIFIPTLNTKKDKIQIDNFTKNKKNVENKISNYINNTIKKKNKYKFLITRDFIKYFLEFKIYDKYNVRKGLLDFFIYDKNIKLIILKRNEENVALAIIWNNTSLKRPFIDYIYIKDVTEKLYKEIYNIFILFIKKKKFIYKDNNLIINSTSEDLEKIEYQIPQEIWKKIKWLPSLNNFKYCTNTGLLKNYDDKTYTYFLIDKQGTFIRENSNKIYWENKIWKNNIWKNGFWENGIWLKGIWENGEWKDGKWINGIWKNGTWKNGKWLNGKWYDGIWENGIWKKGIWYKGIWNGGIWENGTWENGIWNNGTWNNGTWKDGTWNNGNWQNGIWENGTWRNGKWYKGIWKNGIWERGEIYSEKFKRFIISEVSPDKFYNLENQINSLKKFIKYVN